MADDPLPHADRYAELPEGTREFLEQLRPNEVALLEETIRFMDSAKRIGKFMKWVLLVIVGSFLGMVALGDAVIRVWGWIWRV